ncbi:hypothetical protein J3B02_002403 [Coemansia erecta]|nr:hypothetical protein J3B02_002403 [Coemansia erecta]
MSTSVTAKLVEHMRHVLERLQLKDRRLLLAVSGGADSMALSYLVSQVSDTRNCFAITVDHGFRPESGIEAEHVARYMQKLGIHHETSLLKWISDGSDARHTARACTMPPVQRLEETARRRRYTEIADACQRHGIRAVLTGHHAGDQAETFLLRFMRMSGIYGLAGMPEQSALPFASQNVLEASLDMQQKQQSDPALVRPLLDIKKEDLYSLCRAQDIRWHEDSSNADARFRRNQLRQIIGARADKPGSPVNADALLEMCKIMQRHREYIDRQVERLLSQHARYDSALATIELSSAQNSSSVAPLPEWAQNPALCERVLAHVVTWVGCSDHPPELAHLDRLKRAISSHRLGQTAAVSAAGVTMLPPTTRHGWIFCRQPPRHGEIAASVGLRLGASTLWDGRLVVSVAERATGSSSSLSSLSPPAELSWSVLTLDNAIEKLGVVISEHRHWLKQKRCRIAPRAVLASSPVVCVQTSRTSEPEPVFALGYAIEQSACATALDVHVRMLKRPMDC